MEHFIYHGRFYMLSKARSALLANPELSAAAVWATTFVGYLFPSFIKLLPLGADYRDRKSDKESAQGIVDGDSVKVKTDKEKLREAKQRILDSRCARNQTSGYLVFNQRAEVFFIRFNESLPMPVETLENLLKMRFAPDTMKTDVSTQNLYYTETVNRYGYHWDCHYITNPCGKDMKGSEIHCCGHIGWYEDKVRHDYIETTTIKNYYKNILTGEFEFEPLDCGYYSRRFGIAKPNTVLTHEIGPNYQGKKEDGKTFIDYSRDWGSSTTMTYVIDDQVVKQGISVLREEDQNQATTDYVTRVFRFFASFYTALQAAKATNYSLVEERINQTVPGLINNLAAANETLIEHGVVLAGAQAKLDASESAYDAGLLLWLLQLFLVPAGAAGLVYLTLYCLKDRCDSKQTVSQTNDADLEKGALTQKTSGYSPRKFNQNAARTSEGTIEEERLVNSLRK